MSFLDEERSADGRTYETTVCFGSTCFVLQCTVQRIDGWCVTTPNIMYTEEVYYYPTTVLCLGRQTRSHREAMLPSEFLKPISSYYLPAPP